MIDVLNGFIKKIKKCKQRNLCFESKVLPMYWSNLNLQYLETRTLYLVPLFYYIYYKNPLYINVALRFIILAIKSFRKKFVLIVLNGIYNKKNCRIVWNKQEDIALL
jgi:hypothetical protein